MLSFYTGGNVAQTRAAKASALRDLERDHEKKIRDAIKELRGIKVRALRLEKRQTIKSMREEHRRMIAAVRERFDTKIAELIAEAAKMKTDLEGRRIGRKQQKERAKGKATGAEKRQELDEQVENDVIHWRPELVPLWRKMRVGFATRPGMSRFESFQHWIHENPAAVDSMQEQQTFASEIEYACDEARDYVKREDSPETEAWIVDNCGSASRPKRPSKPKGSAASRTGSLFASGEKPPEATAAGAKGRKLKKGPRPVKGQQGLTVGKMKAASLIDTPLEQIPF